MLAFLDDKPIPADDLSPNATLRDFIHTAKAKLAGTETLIVGIRCDGEDIPADRIEEMMSVPASNLQRVDLISGRTDQIVAEALRQTRRAFCDSFPAVQEAADKLTGGDVAHSMQILADCVDLWSQTHDSVVQGSALAGVDFKNLSLAGRSIVDWLNELASKLREIKEAIETRDHVLLGDLLRYDMDETLQGWEQMIGGLIDHIEDAAAPEPASQPAAASPAGSP